jgi:nucleotide-binding universal stress UspA family protein
MNAVLAVIEPGADAAVRSVAEEVARLLNATVRFSPFRPWAGVLRQAAEPDVSAVVIGHASFRFSSFLGHVGAIDRPIVRVPVSFRPPYSLRRVLVPMVGDIATASSLARAIEVSRASDLHVVVLHVAEADSIPAFNDQTAYETEAWAREFLARYVTIPPDQMDFEFRIGDPGWEIVRAVNDLGPDLVALGWGRRSSPGRARVVRRVLRDCQVPVLLVPLAAFSSVEDQGLAKTS